MTSNRAPVLQFIGAARTVTGSKSLLDLPGGRVLVDCGLYQGRKKLRLANWQPFPVDPATIDAVVLTHAHIDHCGYLPRLVKLGFDGPVWCTPGTAELVRILLPDSAHLQEEEAAYANRRGYSKHDPALPLYTDADAQAAIELLRPAGFGETVTVRPGIDVTWHRAGHILGAAFVRVGLRESDTTVVFSGDLGRPTHPLLLPPDPIGAADVLVVESTYGETEHLELDADGVIADVVNDAASCGGVVVVPAFAVDRTEVVLWHLDQLVATGRVPSIPVFVDSPMASRALDFYRGEARRGSPEIRPELHGRELFPALDIVETRSTDESKALNTRRGPMVIVSASGMATGGRVVHHLANRLGDSRNTVLLAGFQAPGTRGDQLRSGATKLKMLGRYVPVRANVVSLELSSHADRSELLDWIGTADAPQIAYVNHGEVDAAVALADAIETERRLPAVVPQPGERVRLNGT
ncbi:MAG: MBL fold metallo-hydrolase [Ilumatobacter sp.]|nr:MBL fold metallo-hydrolase [Ilumatobacter sp.]